jgi:hypothetical protein
MAAHFSPGANGKEYRIFARPAELFFERYLKTCKVA